jgi:hypothetical protein
MNDVLVEAKVVIGVWMVYHLSTVHHGNVSEQIYGLNMHLNFLDCLQSPIRQYISLTLTGVRDLP